MAQATVKLSSKPPGGHIDFMPSEGGPIGEGVIREGINKFLENFQ